MFSLPVPVLFASFLSTPSARRATVAEERVLHKSRFLSTPSARRATAEKNDDRHPGRISIHALREEGDSISSFRPARYK